MRSLHILVLTVLTVGAYAQGGVVCTVLLCRHFEILPQTAAPEGFSCSIQCFFEISSLLLACALTGLFALMPFLFL